MLPDRSDELSWATPLVCPSLADNQVHVWRADLALPPPRVRALASTLSADELARAERYAFAADRSRFVASRGILRKILGLYLKMDPAALRFRYDCRCGRPGCLREHRKPALAGMDEGNVLQFSVSHSHDAALIAAARRREIGVDLERIDPAVDCLALAESAFSANELAALRACGPDQRREAFFAGWTRKEALAKAIGLGLSIEPHQLDVATGADGQNGFSVTKSGGAAVPRWCIYSLDPAPGYAGALAVESPGAELCCLSFDPQV